MKYHIRYMKIIKTVYGVIQNLNLIGKEQVHEEIQFILAQVKLIQQICCGYEWLTCKEDGYAVVSNVTQSCITLIYSTCYVSKICKYNAVIQTRKRVGEIRNQTQLCNACNRGIGWVQDWLMPITEALHQAISQTRSITCR